MPAPKKKNEKSNTRSGKAPNSVPDHDMEAFQNKRESWGNRTDANQDGRMSEQLPK